MYGEEGLEGIKKMLDEMAKIQEELTLAEHELEELRAVNARLEHLIDSLEEQLDDRPRD